MKYIKLFEDVSWNKPSSDQVLDNYASNLDGNDDVSVQVIKIESPQGKEVSMLELSRGETRVIADVLDGKYDIYTTDWKEFDFSGMPFDVEEDSLGDVMDEVESQIGDLQESEDKRTILRPNTKITWTEDKEFDVFGTPHMIKKGTIGKIIAQERDQMYLVEFDDLRFYSWLGKSFDVK